MPRWLPIGLEILPGPNFHFSGQVGGQKCSDGAIMPRMMRSTCQISPERGERLKHVTLMNAWYNIQTYLVYEFVGTVVPRNQPGPLIPRVGGL